MPIGAFYEAILNTPQPLPDVKPEEPATPVKENLQQQERETAEATKASASEEKDTAAPTTARRGRKPKNAAPSKASDPAATATAATAPTASPSSTAKATAKQAQAAAKSSSVSSSAAGVDDNHDTLVAPIPTPPPTRTSTQDQVKVIFGSSLAGPAERAERLARIRAQSTNVAGVLVPPKPEEPDNCCMSGCVNCVWDRFRDEMEEWAIAKATADKRLAAAARQKELGEGLDPSIPRQPSMGATSAVSMDDDGGGSETNWDVGAVSGSMSSSEDANLSKDFWNEDLYKNVPVGIREFMKQEKKLKEKHMREGTTGG